MSSKDTRTFGPDAWAQGTRGILGAWATSRAHIENLRLWKDGSLGPRPKWYLDVNLTTQTNANTLIHPGRFIHSTIGTITDGFFVVAPTITTFYGWGSTSVVASFTATYDNISPDMFVSQIDETTYLVGDYLLEFTGIAPLMSSTDVRAAIVARFGIAGLQRMAGSAVHQGRAFYWGTDTPISATYPLNRIYYSDAYAYGTFTSATQFFDVDGEIQGAVSVGANLFIWTITGEWFVLQGRGDPADGTLNSIGRGRLPGQGRRPVRFDNHALFLASDATTTVSLGEGGDLDDSGLRRVAFSGASYDYFSSATIPNVAANSVENAVIVGAHTIATDPQAFQLWNGAWTEESWDDDLTMGTARTFRAGEILSDEIMAVYDSNWKMYRRDVSIDAPEVSSGFAETPEAKIELPRINDPLHRVRVNRVIVDCRYWKGASYETPQITGTIADGEGATASLLLGPSTDLLASAPNATGDPLRMVFTPSDLMPYTHFTDIKFSAMKGLAIERVSVEIETTKGKNL